MQFAISDDVISQFLSGTFTILALIAVGGILSIILASMGRRFPFSRLAVILALSPFSLIGFLDRSEYSTLYFYAMIVILLGITIDGIAHLLEPKTVTAEETHEKTKEVEVSAAAEPGVIVWEKAE
jgi:hypothetical protein